jgi:hypothetical protein
MQRNLRKLKHIHIIPLTGTKLLPATAEGVLSIPGHTLGGTALESIQFRRCIGYLQFDSQEPEERLE